MNWEWKFTHWLLTIAAAMAWWHTVTRTGVISTDLVYVLFPVEFIVSLYNYNGRARVVCHVVEKLVDRCIQKLYGIREHYNQSGTGRPWTHNWISHEASADDSSFGACLPTCGGGSDNQESVWGSGLDVLRDIQLLLHVLGPSLHRAITWTNESCHHRDHWDNIWMDFPCT